MQVHEYTFIIDATPEEIWAAMHPPLERRGADTENPRIIEHGDVTIEILCEGDEHGDGLVRHCYFPVPKYLMSGGRAQSWEMVSQVRPNEYSRYDAIGKPLWSRAMGWIRLDDLDDGRTTYVPRGVRGLQPDPARAAREARARVHRARQRPEGQGRDRASARRPKSRASHLAPSCVM